MPYPTEMPDADFHALLAPAHGVALGVRPFGQADLAAAPALEVVGRIGVGYDAVDVPALTRRRIPLMTTGTANSVSVAEQAVFFILALAKRWAALDAMVKQGRWDERFTLLPTEIAGKTALVVGFGRIGTRAAARLRGFEMRVLVFDPYVDAAAIRAAGCEAAADLDAALAQADFVTIHCPRNTPRRSGMFDAARLGRMKRGAVLVNTARGGIVDEAALHAALASGHLSGAGLDVFAEEPTPLEEHAARAAERDRGPACRGCDARGGGGDGAQHGREPALGARRRAAARERGQSRGVGLRQMGELPRLKHFGWGREGEAITPAEEVRPARRATRRASGCRSSRK